MRACRYLSSKRIETEYFAKESPSPAPSAGGSKAARGILAYLKKRAQKRARALEVWTELSIVITS